MAKRIVVIDDSGLIRGAARMGLERFGGHEALVTASGAEGLSIAQTARPDAILLDVVMPDLDGPATLACLQASAETRDVPVVFMTGLDDAVRLAHLRTLPGVVDVIAKPFDVQRLPTLLQTALGWPD